MGESAQGEARPVSVFNLEDRDLAGASAIEAKLTRARLEGADLSGAKLEHGQLEGVRLLEGTLEEAKARYIDLGVANMTQASLDDADLTSATLVGAILRSAILRRASLGHANLVAADLSGADLRGADLQHAKLHRANLDGAILFDADLRGATGLTQPQLDRAVGNRSTRLDPPLRVWSCWESRPRELDHLLGNPWLSEADRDGIERFVCTRERHYRSDDGTSPVVSRPARDPVPATLSQQETLHPAASVPAGKERIFEPPAEAR